MTSTIDSQACAEASSVKVPPGIKVAPGDITPRWLVVVAILTNMTHVSHLVIYGHAFKPCCDVIGRVARRRSEQVFVKSVGMRNMENLGMKLYLKARETAGGTAVTYLANGIYTGYGRFFVRCSF